MEHEVLRAIHRLTSQECGTLAALSATSLAIVLAAHLVLGLALWPVLMSLALTICLVGLVLASSAAGLDPSEVRALRVGDFSPQHRARVLDYNRLLAQLQTSQTASTEGTVQGRLPTGERFAASLGREGSIEAILASESGLRGFDYLPRRGLTRRLQGLTYRQWVHPASGHRTETTFVIRARLVTTN